MGLFIFIFLLAVFFAIFGFGGFLAAFTTAALILFWFFLVLFIVGLFLRLIRGRWWWY